MSFKSKLLASVAVAATGLIVGSASAEEPIRIGFAISESGYMANWDIPLHRTAVMKIEEINANGGLLGRQIEYIVRDTKTDQALAASVGQELIAEGVDFMVVSNDYDNGAPAALAASQAGIVVFAPGAGDPKFGVQGIGPFAYSGGVAGQTEGIAMAEYAQQKLGATTAYVLEDTTSEYNKSACAGFRAGWQASAPEGSLLGNDTFMSEDPSIASQITRIRALATPPDVIFICTFPPAGPAALRQIRASGLDMPVFGPTAMADNHWLASVPDLENFYIPARMSLTGDDPRPEINSFIAEYKTRYDMELDSSQAILGYNIIEQWAHAVEQAGTTEGAEVAAVLNSFTNQEFRVGPASYTDELHIQTDVPFLIMKVEDNSFRSVEMFRASFAPDMNLLFRR
jgi:branched-chain amino acid transport system substrate-binding protein